MTSWQPGRDVRDALSREARRRKSMALHGSALARHQYFALDGVGLKQCRENTSVACWSDGDPVRDDWLASASPVVEMALSLPRYPTQSPLQHTTSPYHTHDATMSLENLLPLGKTATTPQGLPIFLLTSVELIDKCVGSQIWVIMNGGKGVLECPGWSAGKKNPPRKLTTVRIHGQAGWFRRLRQ